MPAIDALRFRAAVLWAALVHIIIVSGEMGAALRLQLHHADLHHRPAPAPPPAPGLGLQTGQSYTLRLAQSKPCGTRLLGFNNRTCGGPGGGPRFVPASAQRLKWRTWKIRVLGRVDEQGFRVTLQASPRAKPRCPGYLAAVGSGACPFGPAANTVALVTSNATATAQWLLLPVPGFNAQYEVVAAGRRPGCPRYLSAAPSCRDPRPRLAGTNDGRGNQRWEVVAAGAPGAPTLVVRDRDEREWYVDLSWADGAPGTPEETYTVTCVRKGDPCDGAPVVATSGIARGTEAGRVGLPSTPVSLVCYVMATNAAGATCSDGYPVKGRALKPGWLSDLPTVKFFIYDTYLGIEWAGGASFFPEETYEAWCVHQGQNYDAPPVSGFVAAPRTQRSLTLQGLQRSTNYTCFVSMSNGAVWYPFMERITTLGSPPRAPQPPTDVQAVPTVRNRGDLLLTVSWHEVRPAYPEEKYQVSLKSSGAAHDGALTSAAPCRSTAFNRESTAAARMVKKTI